MKNIAEILCCICEQLKDISKALKCNCEDDTEDIAVIENVAQTEVK